MNVDINADDRSQPTDREGRHGIGAGFTIAVRVRISELPDHPAVIAGIEARDGAQRLRLEARIAGTDPALAESDRCQNYARFVDAAGRATILECVYRTQPPLERLEMLRAKREQARRAGAALAPFEPAGDWAEGLLRVGVPTALLASADRVHLIFRVSRAHVELFVDGVRVDEEWPAAEFPDTAGDRAWSDARAGAADCRLWDQAIDDAQIVALAGGAAAVERRSREIFGPDRPIGQYWAPPGHNTWTGDVMLTAAGDRLHLFWLTAPRLGTSKFGCGAAQFGHAVTSDLRQWEHRPLALPITEPWEAALGTACIVAHGGAMHLFSKVLTERLGISDRFPSGVYSAVAPRDGEPFVKQGYRGFDGEPGVVRDPATGMFHAVSSSRHADGIYYTARYESSDLHTWRLADRDFLPSPGWPPSRSVFSSECFCWFEWNGWWYIIGGRTGFWRSRALLGPYRSVLDADPDAPRWDIYDGVIVPQVAVFRGRAILGGWLAQNAVDYAGHLVFRELFQNDRGELYIRRLPELEPTCGAAVPLHISLAQDAGIDSASPRFFPMRLPANTARLRLRLDPRGCRGPFGLRLGASRESGGSGADLIFDPDARVARWASPQPGRIADASTEMPFNGGDFAILGVEDMHQPFLLDIALFHDAKSGSSIIDAQIGDRRTLITRRAAFNPATAALFAQAGAPQASGEAHPAG